MSSEQGYVWIETLVLLISVALIWTVMLRMMHSEKLALAYQTAYWTQESAS